jgi:hypothetical protein
MSKIQVDSIVNNDDTGAPDCPRGLTVTGVVTATSYIGDGSTLTGIGQTVDVRTNSLVVSGITTVAAGSTSAPSITPTGDSNTGIFFPSADTIGFAEGGNEAARIDSSGRLLIGTTSATTGTSSQYSFLQVVGGSSSQFQATMNLCRNENSADISLNELLGEIYFCDKQAGEYAKIKVNCDGTAAGSGDYPGRIEFHTTADGESSPTERMRIDSQGRMGLGTYSPGERLVVSGGCLQVTGFLTTVDRPSSSVMDFINGSTRFFSIGADSSTHGQFIFNTSTTTTVSERARIDSSGRLLVGTSSARGRYTLQLEGNSESSADVGELWMGRPLADGSISSGTGLGKIYFGGQSGGVGAKIEGLGDAQWGTNDYPGRLAFFTTADGASTPTERMRIDSSGEILINSTTSRTNVANLEPRIQIEGVNNDTSTVAVISNSTSDGTAAQLHLCKSGASGVGSNGAVVNNEVLGRVVFDGSDGTNFVSGADILSTCEANAGTNAMTANLRFYTNNGGSGPSERMRIGNAGETQIASRPNVTTLLLRYAGSPDAGRNILEVFRDAGMDSGVQNCVIRSDGNLYNTNNTYGSLSDIKLKENIVDASSQWDNIKALQVRNYNFREDTGHETHTQIGVVAQEVELVSPRLVTESPDRDTDGNELGTVTKSVNYSVLYMKAVKALQEAMERIETLESKVAALEAN